MIPQAPAVVKSCVICPSYIAPNTTRQKDMLGTNLGGPICGLKMKMLGMPNQDAAARERALRSIAKTCDKYGEDVKFQPLQQRDHPFLEIGLAPHESGPAPVGGPPVGCISCANFVPLPEVMRKTGWSAPACRAKGSLMIDSANRLPGYAQSCGKSYPWDVLNGNRDMDGFLYWGEYSDTFGTHDYARAYRTNLQQMIDPRDWKNEREGFTPNPTRNIRAYRKIEDPDDYGPPIFLPIYDSMTWKEKRPELFALIPQIGDATNPEDYADHSGHLYAMAVMWMKLDETPALWGSGGVGKTEFLRHLAWLMQLPFNRISITASSDVDEIIGKFVYEANETKFIYGQLPESWIRPGVIAIDEPNTGPDEIWQQTRPLFDNSRTLILSQNKKEQLARHPDAYPALAMNPNWDVLNVGTNVIGDADLSRIMHMYMDYPPENLEREIIRRRLKRNDLDISDGTLDSVMKVTVDLRAQSRKGTISTSWGVRHNIKVASALSFFPPVRAYKYAIGDALDPVQFEPVKSSIESIFGVI